MLLPCSVTTHITKNDWIPINLNIMVSFMNNVLLDHSHFEPHVSHVGNQALAHRERFMKSNAAQNAIRTEMAAESLMEFTCAHDDTDTYCT